MCHWKPRLRLSTPRIPNHYAQMLKLVTVKEADRKIKSEIQCSVTLDHQRDKPVGPRSKLSLKHHRRQKEDNRSYLPSGTGGDGRVFGEDRNAGVTEGSRKRGRANVRGIDSAQEAAGTHLLKLSRAVEDRTPWMSLILRVARRRSCFKTHLLSRAALKLGTRSPNITFISIWQEAESLSGAI